MTRYRLIRPSTVVRAGAGVTMGRSEIQACLHILLPGWNQRRVYSWYRPERDRGSLRILLSIQLLVSIFLPGRPVSILPGSELTRDSPSPCLCTQTGPPATRPPEIGIIADVIPGGPAGAEELCTFCCNHSYCPTDKCYESLCSPGDTNADPMSLATQRMIPQFLNEFILQNGRGRHSLSWRRYYLGTAC